MKCLNLGFVALILASISVNISVTALSNSRLDLIFIHWDIFNVTGSYFKVKNSPYLRSEYVVNISSKHLPDESDDPVIDFKNYTLIIQHDKDGLALIKLEWPADTIGTEINITVIEEPTPNVILPDFLGITEPSPPSQLSVYSDATDPVNGGVFYPRNNRSANISMLKVNRTTNTWRRVWDYKEENWLINLANPQQLELIEFQPTRSTVFCFICERGLTTKLANYTLHLESETTNSSFSLQSYNLTSDGRITVAHNTTDATSYSIIFRGNINGKVKSSIAAQGRTADIQRQPARTYQNKHIVDGPSVVDVYLNEIHFPRLEGSKEADKQYWIEIIGRPGIDLTSYCISLIAHNVMHQDIVASACLRPDDSAALNSNGYYIWTINESAPIIQHYVKNSSYNTIYLHREDKVSYKLVDEFNFHWIAAAEDDGACYGDPESQYCLPVGNASCDTLCLRSSALLEDKSILGISRCGIQKYPALKKPGTKMGVWYISDSTRKAWNKCPLSGGYLKRVAQRASIVTIGVRNDAEVLTPSLAQSRSHLPNMGLMFMFWNYHDTGGVVSLSLEGGDLTLNTRNSLYPVGELNITLLKSGVPSVSETSMTATGGTLKSVALNQVYAIGLVRYYSFLPPFDVNDKPDQVVDAIVFASPHTPLNLPMVTTFLSDTGQGQLVLQKHFSTNPILVNADPSPRFTNGWRGINRDGSTYELDKLYASAVAQRYIRIDRIGDSNSRHIDLRLVELPEDYKSLYLSKGLPLNRLCLVVVQTNGPNTWVLMAATSLETYDNLEVDGRPRRIVPDPLKAYSWNMPTYVMLFTDNNETDLCRTAIDINKDDTVNGTFPAGDVQKHIIDGVRIGFKNQNGNQTPQDPGELIKLVVISDGFEAVRCNSIRPFYNPAFSVVRQGASCPVPSQFYIYKTCQQRMGIARDRMEGESYTPFPTDYLYLYQLNIHNQIMNFTSLVDVHVPLLVWQYTVISTPKFILKSDTVASFGLGWFPYPDVPVFNGTVTNHTLNVVVVYPNEAMENSAKTRLTKILETAEHPETASRPIVMFLPSVLDHRHCLFGCDRATAMVEIIDYETNQFNINDEICYDTGFTGHYKGLRINEININVRGFSDVGEYIELTGQGGFKYSGGVSIAIIHTNSRGIIVYQRVKHITGPPQTTAFDGDGYFIFDHLDDTKQSTANFGILRFIPNDYGAVVLMWGAQLVEGLTENSEVTADHVNMPDLFLDVVVYANNQSTSHSDNVQRLVSTFSTGKVPLRGNVAIETLGIENSNETISRCFCNDSWNMDCFEMSFNETKRHHNVCPTLYRKNVTLCMKRDVKNAEELIRDHIDKLMSDSPECRVKSCSFSRHQIKDFSSCPTEDIKDKDSLIWSFVVGFPSQLHLDTFGPIITVDNLINAEDEVIFDCKNAACVMMTPVNLPPTKSSVEDGRTKHTAATIGGTIGGLLALILIIIVVVIIVQKRQKRLRHLSARFEANNEDEDDDDSFLPDGRISFSNPWYNQTANGGGSNSAKNEYRKLSHST